MQLFWSHKLLYTTLNALIVHTIAQTENDPNDSLRVYFSDLTKLNQSHIGHYIAVFTGSAAAPLHSHDVICFLEQGMLVPQLPAGEGQSPVEAEVPEEAMERLAHLEQLVVQLKELIREKDTHLTQKDTELAHKDAQLKVCVCALQKADHCIHYASVFYDCAPMLF